MHLRKECKQAPFYPEQIASWMSVSSGAAESSDYISFHTWLIHICSLTLVIDYYRSIRLIWHYTQLLL